MHIAKMLTHMVYPLVVWHREGLGTRLRRQAVGYVASDFYKYNFGLFVIGQ